jgi:hypothetical protein
MGRKKMRKTTDHIEEYRVVRRVGTPYYSRREYGFNGVFSIPSKLLLNGKKLFFTVLCSDQLGWDHVSVSLPHRTPTWEEMCLIKDLFFDDEETAIQYHPKKSDYVNNHTYCLHLWRNQEEEPTMPPTAFV